MAKKVNWKKVLQAGAYATDALSKGSAGGLGKALVDSKIDLSGAFDEQNTKDAAGQALKKKKILNPEYADPFGKNRTNYNV